MSKRTVSILLAGLLSFSCMTGCGTGGGAGENPPPAEPAPATEAAAEPQDTAEAVTQEAEEAGPQETEEAEPKYETFKSSRGWSVEYDSNVISCEDNTDPADEVTFTYTGKASGDNYLTIAYGEGKLPPEEIDGIKDIQDSGTKTTIDGGIFPGTTDKWAYWLDFEKPDDTSGDRESIILGEYNGGTLYLTFRTHKSGDDEIDIPVSDALAMIVDTIKFDSFEAQTMYDGIPGIYVQQLTEEIEGEMVTYQYEVQLADDHTGVLCMQDDMAVQWDDKIIRGEDGSFSYRYTIEGDKLIIDYDGDKLEFTKSDGEGRINPPVPADMEKYESVISTLPKDSYIAFCEMFKDKESENDVLLVADPKCLFDNNEGAKACTEAKIYGIDKDGKVKEYGDAISGGTRYALSVYEGCLYTGNHEELTRMYIDEEKGELVKEEKRPEDELDKAMELAFFPAQD